MQPPMQAWLRGALETLASLKDTAVDLALEQRGPAEAEAMARLFEPVADPGLGEAPVAEQLAAVRNVSERMIAAHANPGVVAAQRAILALCDAIDADDGSPAALERFRRAEKTHAVTAHRSYLAQMDRLVALIPERRPDPGAGLGNVGLRALMRSLVGVLSTALSAEGQAVPDAALLAEARAFAARLPRPSARVALGAFLDAIEADDGSPEAWAHLRGTIAHHLRVQAAAQYAASLAAQGS
jgi:hypothetical protein